MKRAVGMLCCFAGGSLLPLEALKNGQLVWAIILMLVGVGLGMYEIGRRA